MTKYNKKCNEIHRGGEKIWFIEKCYVIRRRLAASLADCLVIVTDEDAVWYWLCFRLVLG